MKEKIMLGTVQLGLSYGINNLTGKPSEAEAFKILDYAFENNIRLLDTADGYGEALHVIGNYNATSRRRFKIINKFKADDIALSEHLAKSLSLLQVSSLFCYMYHQFTDYASGLVKEQLRELRKSGLIEKTGVSLYDVQQLIPVIDDKEIDIIQIPVNLLDLSKEKEELLIQAKRRGKEIHARSVYLQGLFFKDSTSLTGNLKNMEPYLKTLKLISESHHMDLKKAALNYVLQKEYIDRVVLGIDNVTQLVENLKLVDESLESQIFSHVVVEAKDEYLLNPSNWKP